MRIQSASTEDCSSQSCALHFAWSVRVLYFFHKHILSLTCEPGVVSAFFRRLSFAYATCQKFIFLSFFFSSSVFSFLLPSSHHRSSSDSSPFFLTFCAVFLCEARARVFFTQVITWKVWSTLILFSLPTFSRCLGRKSQECKSYSSTSSHNLRGYTSLSSSFGNFVTFSRNLAKCRVAESV